MWQGIITSLVFAILGYYLDQKYLIWKRRRALRAAKAEYKNLAFATYALAEDTYIKS